MQNKKTPLSNCIDFVESYKKDYTGEVAPYQYRKSSKSFKISKNRIFKIHKESSKRNLGLVDGGSASIISGADFNISFNRVAGVLFKKNKITSLSHIPDLIEFFAATLITKTTDDKIAYATRLFPREKKFEALLPKEDIIIPIDEVRDLMGFKFMPKVEIFGGVAMRFAEWAYSAKFIEKELFSGDVFIRDGSLQTGYKEEILLVRNLFKSADQKEVYVTGLSKSCRLITSNGDCLVSLVDMVANKKFSDSNWYYHPIYQITEADNLADVLFVKLHDQSATPFRLDFYLEQSKNLDIKEREIIISNLAANSNDLSFPGYPYGLIKVDQLSRVAKREIEPLRVQIISEFDSDIYKNYILPRIKSIDAHDLLNQIRKN